MQIKSDIKNELGYGMLVLVMALCYTALRFSFNCEYAPVSFDVVYSFGAPMPFGKRILTPLLAHLIVLCGLSVYRAFWTIEILASIALMLGLRRIFQLYGGEKFAKTASILFMVILPNVFLVQRLNSLLFPWDTPAMALTVWGIYCILTAKWNCMFAVMALASLNRESAILLPALFLGIYVGKIPFWKYALMGIALLVLYVTCQKIIAAITSNNLMVYRLHGGMSWSMEGSKWRIMRNWEWLDESRCNVGDWLSSMAWLPLFFITLAKKMPGYFRRFGLVALGYGAMLLFVGLIYEARVWGEIVVLLYVPVSLSILGILLGQPVWNHFRIAGENKSEWEWLVWAERGIAIAVLFAVIGGFIYLRNCPVPE